MTDPAEPTAFDVPLTPPQSRDATGGLLWRPASATAADVPGVVLGHGAGSTMHSPILAAVAAGLAGQGHPVAAFNFAYAEAGRRGPDPMPRLESAFRDAVATFLAEVGQRPLILGGRSMGGRVASRIVAQSEPCAGLLLLGYPLHPAGKPDQLRVDHWPALDVPLLFVSGTRDSLFSLELFERHRASLPGPVTLHVLDGADHGFHVRRSDGRSDAEVLDEVVTASVRWVAGLGRSA